MTGTHAPPAAEGLARRRTQMGDSIRGWGVIPGAVSEVSDRHWLLLLADAYGMPAEIARLAVEPVVTGASKAGHSDMRFWLVEDGTPVSAVLDARSGDAVTLWCMSTPQRFARRGYARALLAHVLHVARAEGAAIGLLGATPAGKPLYDATGWRTLEQWRLFVRGESVQFV